MGIRAKGRLALAIAGAIAFIGLSTQQLFACGDCTPEQSAQDAPANARPAEPGATEKAAEPLAPLALKKFTRQQSRSTRRMQTGNAALTRRASAGKYASRKARQTEQAQDEAASAPSVAKAAPAFSFANANAELVEPAGVKPDMPQPAAPPAPVADVQPVIPPAIATEPTVELVSADEFNELDRAAWETNQMPKLLQLTGSNSRAELRDSDSTWAHTSTIGKLFVVFGALLTIGSAIRMFIA